jgi:hypothetical protein
VEPTYPAQPTYPPVQPYPSLQPSYRTPQFGSDPSFPPPPPMPTGAPGAYSMYPGGYGAATGDSIVPTDFSSWFANVFAAFKRSWKSLLFVHGLAVIPALILGVAQQFSLRNQVNDLFSSDGQTRINFFGGSTGTALLLGLLAIIVSWLLRAVASLATAHLISRDAAAEQLGSTHRAQWTDGLRFASSRLGPMIGWGLVTGLLTVVGFVLCIGPGIWLGVVFFSSVTGVIAFERGHAFERSFALIKGQWWSMFGRAAMMTLLMWGINFVIGLGIIAMFGASISTRSTPAIVVTQVLATVAGLPMAMLVSIAAVIAYAELRSKQQFTTAGQLASEAALAK